MLPPENNKNTQSCQGQQSVESGYNKQVETTVEEPRVAGAVQPLRNSCQEHYLPAPKVGTRPPHPCGQEAQKLLA